MQMSRKQDSLWWYHPGLGFLWRQVSGECGSKPPYVASVWLVVADSNNANTQIKSKRLFI
jgi:hypothetical protein